MRGHVHWMLRISCLVVAVACGATARSEFITSGTVQFVFDNNSPLFVGGTGPLTMDRWYGPGVDTLTGIQIESGTGGDPIVVPPSGLVDEQQRVFSRRQCADHAHRP